MKSFLLMVGIGLALATPFQGEHKFGEKVKPNGKFEIKESVELEDPAELVQEPMVLKKYPEVITEIEKLDLSKFNVEEFVQQFANTTRGPASMGIDPRVHPDLIADAFSTTCQMVQRRGYDCEIHRMQTSDGYILEMHRIPGGPKSPTAPGKRVAYLQHGLLDTSAGWVIMGVDHSLGYILCDLGYDVWLGNVRGNRYSREHITNDPDGNRGNRRRFWDFSWHQMGTTDLPTMIDYITSVTGERRMHYVGHSQGTTSFFVMCSQRPEYNDRIISSHMLAPIAFMSRIVSPFVNLAAFLQNTLDFGASILGIYEFLPNSQIMALLGQAACRDEAWFQAVCSNVLFLIGGFNSAQMNATMLPVIMGHTPAGASVDQLLHYAQNIRRGLFRQWDFGTLSNLIPYGSFSPPRYNLGNIRAPTTLYYSLNDWLSHPRDVRELFDGMTARRQRLIQIADPRFNHFDYLWAIDVKALLYDQVVEIMREYEN